MVEVGKYLKPSLGLGVWPENRQTAYVSGLTEEGGGGCRGGQK